MSRVCITLLRRTLGQEEEEEEAEAKRLNPPSLKQSPLSWVQGLGFRVQGVLEGASFTHVAVQWFHACPRPHTHGREVSRWWSLH